MIDKITTFSVIDSVTYDGLTKHAAAGDLPEPYDPDYVYIRVRAVSAGEYWGPNKNADFFEEEELKKAYKTFMEAHVFLNHENKQVEKAIGSVLEATWNDKMKYVELLLKIDKKLAPTVVRNLEKNVITDVSMGAKVKQSICSICGNIAATRADFCEHVRKMRNEILPDGRQVYELNRGVRFHDISVVLNGADRTAKIVEKVADRKHDGLSKAASAFIVSKYEIPENVVEKVAHSTLDEALAKGLSKKAFLQKISELQKRIQDKLYVMYVINKIGKNPKLKQVVEKLEKSSSSNTGLNKEAIFGGLRDLIIGTTAVGAMSNYQRNKMLRGENVDTVGKFMADNPGLTSGLYIFGIHPIVRPFISKGVNDIKRLSKFMRRIQASVENNDEVIEKFSSEPSVILSKTGNNVLDFELNTQANLIDDNKVCDFLKKEYNYTSKEINILKLASALMEGGRYTDADKLLEHNKLDIHDVDNFLKVSYNVLENELDKEAGLGAIVLRNMMEDALFVPKGQLHKSIVPFTLIDGLIFGKMIQNAEKNEKSQQAASQKKLL